MTNPTTKITVAEAVQAVTGGEWRVERPANHEQWGLGQVTDFLVEQALRSSRVSLDLTGRNVVLTGKGAALTQLIGAIERLEEEIPSGQDVSGMENVHDTRQPFALHSKRTLDNGQTECTLYLDNVHAAMKHVSSFSAQNLQLMALSGQLSNVLDGVAHSR